MTSLTSIAIKAAPCAKLRTKARTGAPRATSAFMTALPVLPPAPVTRIMPNAPMFSCHCEEQSDEAIQLLAPRRDGLLRCARNDGMLALCHPCQLKQPARAERNFQEVHAAPHNIELIL